MKMKNINTVGFFLDSFIPSGCDHGIPLCNLHVHVRLYARGYRSKNFYKSYDDALFSVWFALQGEWRNGEWRTLLCEKSISNSTKLKVSTEIEIENWILQPKKDPLACWTVIRCKREQIRFRAYATDIGLLECWTVGLDCWTWLLDFWLLDVGI